MPKASVEDVAALLIEAGATDGQAEHLVAVLGRAGLSPAQMRAWLASASRGYSVQVDTVTIGSVTAPWKLVPSWAIEDGHVKAVVAAAEAYAAAAPQERLIARTLLCDVAAVREITHEDPERMAIALRIANLLLSKLRKTVAVREAIHVALSGGFDDATRLVDWMRDERLPVALDALEQGTIDPVELRARGPLIP